MEIKLSDLLGMVHTAMQLYLIMAKYMQFMYLKNTMG